jgi:hypothetical protein
MLFIQMHHVMNVVNRVIREIAMLRIACHQISSNVIIRESLQSYSPCCACYDVHAMNASVNRSNLRMHVMNVMNVLVKRREVYQVHL